MRKIVDFIKQNWLVSLLLLAVLYLVFKDRLIMPYGLTSMNYATDSFGGSVAEPMMAKGSLGNTVMYRESAPVVSSQRMVVQDTSLSMQVNDVAKSLASIEKVAVDAGGYMVDRNMTKPEGAASGYITVRVPTEKRESSLDSIKALAIKTVSENVFGNDVTDQHVDLQGRIDSLNKTKVRMQALLDQAVRVQDLMDIQMQITNIQEQIDNYTGQQKYLEQTAKLTRISVNLSTDDLALPYAPDSAWRPEVVFKTAVRSMLVTLRSLANFVIWVAVYVPVVIALLAVYFVVRYVWTMMKHRKPLQ